MECNLGGQYLPHIFKALGSALHTESKIQVCYLKDKDDTATPIVFSTLSALEANLAGGTGSKTECHWEQPQCQSTQQPEHRDCPPQTYPRWDYSPSKYWHRRPLQGFWGWNTQMVFALMSSSLTPLSWVGCRAPFLPLFPFEEGGKR